MPELWMKLAVDFLQNPKVLRCRRDIGEECLAAYLQLLGINRIRSCRGLIPANAAHPLSLGQMIGYPEARTQQLLDGLERHGLIQRDAEWTRIVGWSDTWESSFDRKAGLRDKMVGSGFRRSQRAGVDGWETPDGQWFATAKEARDAHAK